MDFRIGDYVSRISHKHDIVFKIVGFDKDIVYLYGVDFRLCADSKVDDLVKVEDYSNDEDRKIVQENIRDYKFDRNQFFYLPGKILHIDSDGDYLDRCMDFYKNMNIKANGIVILETEVADRIYDLLVQYRPDIVVITGHDSYNNKDINSIDNYENTINYINAVKAARKYERSQDKLIIIAGACQSNYEELIKAGANFASSPKRVNIHALDPAIIASSIALSDKHENIELIKIIDKTKYGKDGVGGIISNGTMYVGYPRWCWIV